MKEKYSQHIVHFFIFRQILKLPHDTNIAIDSSLCLLELLFRFGGQPFTFIIKGLESQ